MAKKRGRPQAVKRNVTPTAVTIRGTRGWRLWLEDVANAQRILPTAVIDQALMEWAATRGLRTPPRRLEEKGGSADAP
jgi:hypothetical protein